MESKASNRRRASHLAGLTPLLEAAQRGGYAVGALNFCNAETAEAIVEQAAALGSPVVLMTGPWEMPLLGAKARAAIVERLAAEADVPVCLHLDHAGDLDSVRECLEAGFPSVMFDGSRQEFEENVRLTREAVEMARAWGATVEGELGAVGSVGAAEGDAERSLTEPQQAAEFVERTGVDALAVAIGNAHGIYPQRPELDFERLARIREATQAPLVLHGGSGMPAEQLQRAVAAGISKVNVASELSRAYLGAIEQALAATGGSVWYAEALLQAKTAVGQVARRWMLGLGSAGRAA